MLFFNIIFLNSCKNDALDKSNITSFDLSKNDSLVLFSVYTQNKTAIYQIDINGHYLKKIIEATEDSSFYCAKFSNNDERILFIGTVLSQDKPYSSLYLINKDGTGRKKITTGNQLISDAVSSKYDNKIYFVKNNEYEKYSPMGHAQAHGSDIYSIDLNSNMVRKVTNLNAYSIQYLSEYNKDSLLFYIPVQDSGGMIVVSKNNFGKINRINPINSPRQDISILDIPRYQENTHLFSFSVYSELYLMPMGTKRAFLLKKTESKNPISYYNFFNKKSSLIFVNNNELYFNLIDFKGIKFKKIYIELR